MPVIRPRDWERLDTSILNIVVKAKDGEKCHRCVLWDADTYFKKFGSESPVLASAEMVQRAPDLWSCQFDRIGAWQNCVIGVYEATGRLIEASGVSLGISENSSVLRVSPLTAKNEFRFPLPKVRTNLSNFQASGSEISANDQSGNPAFYVFEHGDRSMRQKTLYPAERHDARDVMIIEHCMGVDDPAFQRERENSVWHSASGYLALFADADVYLRSGVLVDDAGLWGDGAAAGMSDPNLTHFPDLFRVEKELGKFDAGLFRQLNLGGPLFMLGNAGFGNFAHWMMNSLFAAYLLKDDIARTGGALVCPRLPYFARESLRLLGMERYVIETDERYIRARRVAYPSPLSTHANMFPPSAFVGMVKQLKALAVASPLYENMEAPAFIYMTRRGFESQRKFVNEEALAAELKAAGFVTIATHELSMIERLKVFSKAKVIVSQLGAALTHMLFVPKGCFVVEITTPNYHSNEYWYLAKLLELRFVRFMLQAKEENFISNSNFEFEIDVAEAVGKIRKLQ